MIDFLTLHAAHVRGAKLPAALPPQIRTAVWSVARGPRDWLIHRRVYPTRFPHAANSLWLSMVLGTDQARTVRVYFLVTTLYTRSVLRILFKY
jgi:hypothetical protein